MIVIANLVQISDSQSRFVYIFRSHFSLICCKKNTPFSQPNPSVEIKLIIQMPKLTFRRKLGLKALSPELWFQLLSVEKIQVSRTKIADLGEFNQLWVGSQEVQCICRKLIHRDNRWLKLSLPLFSVLAWNFCKERKEKTAACVNKNLWM